LSCRSEFVSAGVAERSEYFQIPFDSLGHIRKIDSGDVD